MEVGDDIMSEEGENFNFSDKKNFSLDDIHDNIVEPYAGMLFDSEERAMAYYDSYAKRVGFVIRIGNCHRSSQDGSVISRRLLCNKEGFRANKKVVRPEVRKPRAVMREGCKAMFMVRKEKSGKWIVAKLGTHHSHPLGMPPRRNREVSIPARSQDEKDKRIRELTAELHHTKRQLTECQKQLHTVLKDVELHVDHLARSIQHIAHSVEGLEEDCACRL